MVEAKARTVGGGTEVRQLLFAALMLADENQELHSRRPVAPAAERAELAAAKAREDELQHALDAALQQLAALQDAPVSPAAPPPTIARALEQMADRIEALANKVAP